MIWTKDYEGRVVFIKRSLFLFLSSPQSGFGMSDQNLKKNYSNILIRTFPLVMRINSLITWSNGGYEVAPHSRSPHQRPASFGSRGQNSCWIWYLSHISRQTQKGFGLVFPPGRRGNGEWDIALLAEVTVLISRQTPSFVGSAPYQHLWGQASHRESVSLWAVETIIIGETILEAGFD